MWAGQHRPETRAVTMMDSGRPPDKYSCNGLYRVGCCWGLVIYTEVMIVI